MKNKRFFINNDSAFVTYMYTGKSEDCKPKEDMSEVSGYITLIVKSEFLFMEKRLPIHFKEWIKDAQHLEGDWWIIDKSYCNLESFSTISLSKQIRYELPTNLSPRKAIIHNSKGENDPTEIEVKIILTDNKEVVKEINPKETISVLNNYSNQSLVEVTYVEMLTTEKLEEIVSAVINM